MTDPARTVSPPLTPVARPERRSGRLLVAAIIALAAIAIATVIVFRAATGPDPLAARMPADAAAMLQVTLRPSLSQQRTADGLADRLPGGKQGLERFIDRTLAELFANAPDGIGYETFEPWLGDQIGVAFWAPEGTDPQPVVVAHSADDAAAAEAVDRIDAGGAAAASLDRSFVTVARDEATVTAFLAAVDDEPLSRERSFRMARGRVGGDGILLARVDTRLAPPLSLPGSPLGIDALTLPDGVIVVGAQLTDDGVRIAAAEESPFIRTPLPAADELPLAAELAAHADGVAGINDPASLLRGLLRLAPDGFGERLLPGLDAEEDLFSWLGGDAALRVVNFGNNEHHATITIESTDDEAMRSLVGTVRSAIAFGALGDWTVEGSASDRFTVHAGRFDADVTIEGSRLTIEIASRGARTRSDDADPLPGFPAEPAAIAGIVEPGVLIQEAGAVGWLGPDGPLGVYAASLRAISFTATTDDTGPIVTVTLHLEEPS